MSLHPLAGQPVPAGRRIDVTALKRAFFSIRPDVKDPGQRVAFGTSGHRGTSTNGSFNEAHILAISQAICTYRRQRGISGPLFLGADTHALSEVAQATAIQVLVANGVEVRVQRGCGPVPTPVISHAILTHNRDAARPRSDGVVVTPSHNPPDDGGFKYNPPEGGPASKAVTDWIQAEANRLLEADLSGVERATYEQSLASDLCQLFDYVGPYVDDLASVIDLAAIQKSGLKLGVDPLGGASLPYWNALAGRHGLELTVVNQRVDPTFGFMRLDHDGKIRMDCSSPYAMAALIDLKDDFDLAFGNDPDADRHGIVTRSVGLMNPNHFLAVAIWYLFQHRPAWKADCGVGKTLVSSSMIDRVARHLGRRLVEVPVGFKWFVDGLLTGELGFGGEESAGASFLRHDGTVWSTDKDGLIACLLAAEITAVTGRDPGEWYAELQSRFGSPRYARIDAPATPRQKAALANLAPDQVRVDRLAGEPIVARLTHAPGNQEAIGGLKVVTENGWFAARPSGTEDIYKIYAESFKGEAHLRQIQSEAQAIVSATIGG